MFLKPKNLGFQPWGGRDASSPGPCSAAQTNTLLLVPIQLGVGGWVDVRLIVPRWSWHDSSGREHHRVQRRLPVLHNDQAAQPALPARGRHQGAAAQFHDHAGRTWGPAAWHRRHQRKVILSSFTSRLLCWRFGLVGNVVGRINEASQRRARLVLGWVTVCRRG